MLSSSTCTMMSHRVWHNLASLFYLNLFYTYLPTRCALQYQSKMSFTSCDFLTSQNDIVLPQVNRFSG